MSTESRLAKVEKVLGSDSGGPLVVVLRSFQKGPLKGLEIDGRTYKRQPDETEEALHARAVAEALQNSRPRWGLVVKERRRSVSTLI